MTTAPYACNAFATIFPTGVRFAASTLYDAFNRTRCPMSGAPTSVDAPSDRVAGAHHFDDAES